MDIKYKKVCDAIIIAVNYAKLTNNYNLLPNKSIEYNFKNYTIIFLVVDSSWIYKKDNVVNFCSLEMNNYITSKINNRYIRDVQLEEDFLSDVEQICKILKINEKFSNHS